MGGMLSEKDKGTFWGSFLMIHLACHKLCEVNERGDLDSFQRKGQQ